MEEERLEALAEMLALGVIYYRDQELDGMPIDFVTGVSPSWDGMTLLENAITQFITERFTATARPGSSREEMHFHLATLMVDIARRGIVFREQARQTAISVAECVLRYLSWGWRPGQVDAWRAAVEELDPNEAGVAEKYAALILEYWMLIAAPNDNAFAVATAWGRTQGLI